MLSEPSRPWEYDFNRLRSYLCCGFVWHYFFFASLLFFLLYPSLGVDVVGAGTGAGALNSVNTLSDNNSKGPRAKAQGLGSKLGSANVCLQHTLESKLASDIDNCPSIWGPKTMMQAEQAEMMNAALRK
ncbi:hypothetical protein DEU56DRAFT_755649 [Suillus clintonianus]|uniref:uncharacterized protein n=1 Tax=Suillus clintonianus TaxID=1904413 RepID=UPI001B85D01B|nr:uncharacterized protein DEU56DRAFT_755649 [Suillus clintonianus]KAG2139351.1 hypothetical protein DEU56DRAFT_755649 [Suillus clintonianus]